MNTRPNYKPTCGDDYCTSSQCKPTPDIRVGDTITFAKTGKVTFVNGNYAELDSGNGFTPTNYDVTLVNRPKPRPKVGDTVTGKDLAAHEFGPGTVIEYNFSDGWYRMKGRDGYWHANAAYGSLYHESQMTDQYTLVYDPSAAK